jgi:CheY-like chemotaxis protein
MVPSIAWPPAAACDPARTCILVVEDDLLIRFMVSDGLRDEGYHVIEAYNADEALTILKTAVPDMVIRDVRMPGSIDGIELLKLVRDSFPTLPVIMTSGHLDPTQARAEGATQFIAKPYSMEALIESVHVVLGKA